MANFNINDNKSVDEDDSELMLIHKCKVELLACHFSENSPERRTPGE